MRLEEFKLLSDENIHEDVVRFLRDEGHDVFDVREQGLFGATDVDLLRLAVSEGRVVVSHDRDFGALAVLAGEPIVGIFFVRPGHISPGFTIETIKAVLCEQRELTSPFILVAHRHNSQVSMRIRTI